MILVLWCFIACFATWMFFLAPPLSVTPRWGWSPSREKG